ncbi:sensor histidine kinase [Algivirga pacifica]
MVELYQGKEFRWNQQHIPKLENHWISNPHKGLSYEIGATSDWIRIQFSADNDCQKILYFAYPNTPIIDGWIVDENETVTQSFHLGVERPFEVAIPEIFTGYTIKVDAKAHETYTLLVHFESYGQPHHPELLIADTMHLKEVFFQSTLLTTGFRSILLSAILLATVFGFISKQRLFFYYAFLFTGVIIFSDAELGIPRYFFHEDPFNLFLTLRLLGNHMTIHGMMLFLFHIIKKSPQSKFIHFAKKLQWPIFFLDYPLLLLFFIFHHEYYWLVVSCAVLGIAYSYLLVYIYLGIMLYNGIKGHRESLLISLIIGSSLGIAFISVSLPHLGFVQREASVANLSFYIIGTFEAMVFMFLLLQSTFNSYKEKIRLEKEFYQLNQQLNTALLDGQENERNRIGRELHDHIGGNLAIINKSEDILDPSINDIVNKTFKSVRNLSHGLVSPEFQEETFECAIRDLVFIYKHTAMKVSVQFFHWPENSPLDTLQHSYRIVQELLQNGLKHSGGSYIHLQFFGGTEGRFFYEDDGVGFDTSQTTEGIGLKNIHYRVKALGATILIDSGKGGTSISVEGLPLSSEQ